MGGGGGYGQGGYDWNYGNINAGVWKLRQSTTGYYRRTIQCYYPYHSQGNRTLNDTGWVLSPYSTPTFVSESRAINVELAPCIRAPSWNSFVYRANVFDPTYSAGYEIEYRFASGALAEYSLTDYNDTVQKGGNGGTGGSGGGGSIGKTGSTGTRGAYYDLLSGIVAPVDPVTQSGYNSLYGSPTPPGGGEQNQTSIYSIVDGHQSGTNKCVGANGGTGGTGGRGGGGGWGGSGAKGGDFGSNGGTNIPFAAVTGETGVGGGTGNTGGTRTCSPDTRWTGARGPRVGAGGGGGGTGGAPGGQGQSGVPGSNWGAATPAIASYVVVIGF